MATGLALAQGQVTLHSDTGAAAHLFVLEDDIVRLLLLPDGKLSAMRRGRTR